jgi:V/A-type H+/Na+-transporting ATPase subunit I
MKQITMLISFGDRDKFVSRLRKEGVLHVRHVVSPEAHDISFVEDRISRINKLISQVEPYSDGRSDRMRSSLERDVLSCADEVDEDLKLKRETEEAAEKLKKDKLWFEEWGHIKREDLLKVKEGGANIRLYELPAKEVKQVSDKLHIIGRKGSTARVAFVTGDISEELPFQEVSLPEMSEKQIEKELSICDKRTNEIEERFKDRSRALPAVRECLHKLEKEMVALRVISGMKSEGAFAYVQGFAPEKTIPRIKKLCEKIEAGFISEEPDNPDETPTLVTNPKWIEIVKPVFSFMNTLPGYSEFDISFVFLIFFSLFFAMLIGDAGYGLVFIGLASLARKKFPKAPGEPFFLIYLLGGCTVVWGALTGTWFGIEALSSAPILKSVVIEKIGSFSGDNQNFMIQICFIIGAVHLTLAHIMKIARQINSLKALADAGWIMILWGMFFLAGKFVLAGDFPPAAGWLLGTGIILVMFFTSPEKGIVKGMLSGLAQLPLSVISSFSDIVSYLRLFAVGVATVVVADSFNKMAWPGAPASFIGGFLSALVLFLGHSLNIALGCMAVIVHGIRLNMLEFSGHLGMQWSGKAYEPFKE